MRSNLFKYIVAFALVAMVLAACQPAATTAPTSAPTASAPTAAPIVVKNPPTTPEQVDAIVLEGKKTDVIYWHNRPQKDQELLQVMLDEFNKSNKYGITAKAEIAGSGYPDVYNKVNAAIQAGQPPSFSVAYQNQAAFYRKQGSVIDLNPFVKSKKYGLADADLKDYFATFLASDANPQYKGEVLGFPTQRSVDVMYYNIDWLTKLGYKDPPTDWKTFEEMACKAAQEKDKYGWVFRHDASNFASQLFTRGGQMIADDGSKYVFDSAAGIETLQFVQNLFAKKCAVESPVSAGSNAWQTSFAKGDVLFAFASSSGLPFVQDAVAKGANFKWSIAMLPNSGKPAVNLYGASVSVYKTTPEQELATWLVIKFLGEKTQTTKWAISTGYLPVRASAKDDVLKGLTWPDDVKAAYTKMFDWFQYAKVEAPVGGYDPVRDLITKEMMPKVIADPKLDVAALVKNIVTQSNTILKEYAP